MRAIHAAICLIASCASARSPLVGTWTLRAADEIRPDGSRVPSYGESPQGTLMIDDEGRYSLQIFRPGRPRFETGDKGRGTAEEYRAAVLGMSSHIGHVALDAAHGHIVFRIEIASFPNWDATEQKRQFQMTGDELSYQVPAAATGNGTVAVSVWRRVGR
jgi:hypothetical protein